MRKLLDIITMILIIQGCNPQVFIPLPQHDVFKFSLGDTLIYKSINNDFDKIVVDQYSNGVWGPSYGEWNKYVYEHIHVQLHFLHDQRYIELYDSITDLQLDCMRNNDWEYCDSIYNNFSYDMYVEFEVESESPRYNNLIWEKLPKYRLNELDNNNEIVINGHTFERVYILDRDTDFVDSTILVKRIFFNYEYGILKYENNDSITFELQFPVQ